MILDVITEERVFSLQNIKHGKTPSVGGIATDILEDEDKKFSNGLA